MVVRFNTYIEDFSVQRIKLFADKHIHSAAKIAVYVATDVGVYKISVKKDPASTADPMKGIIKVGNSQCTVLATPLLLPGLNHYPLGITHFIKDQISYLWVADANGDCHLFSVNTQIDNTNRWLPQRVIHEEHHVLCLSASWDTRGGSTYCVESRLDDQILVNKFTFQESKSLDYKKTPWTALSHDEKKNRLLKVVNDEELDTGNLVDLLVAIGTIKRKNRKGQSLKPEDAITSLGRLFQFLSKFETQRNKPILQVFLKNPNEQLGIVVLKKFNEKKIQVQAIWYWTFTLMALCNRFPEKVDIKQGYLGLIRWLRKIEESLANNYFPKNCQDALEIEKSLAKTNIHANCRHALEEAMLFVRRWGVFGDELKWRLMHPDSEKILKHETDNPDRDIDKLTADCLLFQNLLTPQHWQANSEKPTDSVLTNLKFIKSSNAKTYLISHWSNDQISVVENPFNTKTKKSYLIAQDKTIQKKFGEPIIINGKINLPILLQYALKNDEIIIEAYKAQKDSEPPLKYSSTQIFENSEYIVDVLKTFTSNNQCFLCIASHPSRGIGFPQIHFCEISWGDKEFSLNLVQLKLNNNAKPTDKQSLILESEIPTAKSDIAQNPVTAMAIAQDDQQIVLGCQDGQVWVVEIGEFP